jgi:hypothetical protein
VFYLEGIALNELVNVEDYYADAVRIREGDAVTLVSIPKGVYRHRTLVGDRIKLGCLKAPNGTYVLKEWIWTDRKPAAVNAL